MRQSALILILLLMFTAALTVNASDLVLLRGNGHEQTPQMDELDEVFYLSRTLDYEAEYYLGSGDLGDTLAVHFHPVAACSILFAEMQFYSAGGYQTFIWDYNDAAEAMYPDGVAPPRGTSPVSPLGDVLFGPFNNSSQGTQEWERLFGETDLPGGGIWNPNGDDFMIGYVKTTEGGDPRPLADDITMRGTSYTWFGGPWMANYDYLWGGYSSVEPIIDLMLRVGVSYPGGAPPIISDIEQLPNTVDPNKQCSFSAVVTDEQGIASVFLRMQQNGGLPVDIEMSDLNGDDVYTADYRLNGHIDDSFTYWVVAEDNAGMQASSYSTRQTFDIVSLPTESVLLITDNCVNSAVVREKLDDMGWSYAWWDVQDNYGLDAAVLAQNWQAVFLMGWGASTIPTREYGDDPYSAYLMNGGNFMFIDQDYFYSNGEPEFPEFAAGDFAYDFFGVEAGTNDPLDEETRFFGIPGTLTEPFNNDPYTLVDFGGELWEDYLDPLPEADYIFYGLQYGGISGVTYDNNFGGRTIYLSFDATLAQDAEGYMTEQFATLMNNVNADLGVDQHPFTMDIVPQNTVINRNGGYLRFDFSIMNESGDEYPEIDFWTRVNTPAGNEFELYWTSLWIEANSNYSFNDLIQAVPGYAPRGKYTFSACMGDYPDVWLSDSFTFYKDDPDEAVDGPGWVTGWDAMYGELAGHDNGDVEAVLPTNAELSQPYPNPFNPSTNFTVTLPEESRLTVAVYNLLGQKVMTLANSRYDAGRYSFTLDASALAAGMYFLHVDAPGLLQQTRKIVLLP